MAIYVAGKRYIYILCSFLWKNVNHLGCMPQRWSKAQDTGREVQAQDKDGDQDEGDIVVA